MSGTSGAGIVVVNVQRQKIREAFTKLGAVNIQKAKTLKELGLKESPIFHQMLHQGILIESDNKYYLDENQADETGVFRRKLLTILIPSAVFVAVLAMILFM